MANWKYTLDVKDAWKQTKAGEMTIQAFARFAVGRIKQLPVFGSDNELLEIVDELSEIAEDEEADADWFDDVWGRLYDWADQPVGRRAGSIWADKMCWVKTF